MVLVLTQGPYFEQLAKKQKTELQPNVQHHQLPLHEDMLKNYV